MLNKNKSLGTNVSKNVSKNKTTVQFREMCCEHITFVSSCADKLEVEHHDVMILSVIILNNLMTISILHHKS